MDDRYYRYDRQIEDDGRSYGPDYGSGQPYTYSSAREYAAAGESRERGRGGYGRDRDYGRGDYGARDSGGRDQGRFRSQGSQGNYAGDYWSDGRRTTEANPNESTDRDYGRGNAQRDYRGQQGSGDRGFFERAGDELRSWFGDEDAERRRERDQRYDARRAGTHDDHYHQWRSERIAELDRDYDEYRRENAQRFQSEFDSWRTERQGQRQGLSKVSEHMEVVGSDGEHVGTVDKVRGDRIILTKNDQDAGGHHHSIPSRWIQSVDDKVTIRKTAEEAKSAWRDEERSGALFGSDQGSDDQSFKSDHNLNRSFSGTY